MILILTHCIVGLGTDGASVMNGRKTGLTGQFLNPHIQICPFFHEHRTMLYILVKTS